LAAKGRVQAFEELNPTLKQPHRGPWTNLVLGEVALANGEPDKAIELFKAARRMRLEVVAPRNCADLLQAALQRAEAQQQAQQQKGK
jgi:uncharacterized protein HemY